MSYSQLRIKSADLNKPPSIMQPIFASCFAVVCIRSTVTKQLCNTQSHILYPYKNSNGNTAQFSRKHTFDILPTITHRYQQTWTCDFFTTSDTEINILEEFQTIPYGSQHYLYFLKHPFGEDQTLRLSC